ncbi:hypothetical protein THRCLA_20049 [Thraustotheca clavata]|uniref:Uncharacterized protein n=1 Tax=Thraustotheca clavata TaxID=74557 RepID=A0A1W0AC26_9STRA|nr:hypothetical protein THRCLA_20049 [Thraustotheca clavata]
MEAPQGITLALLHEFIATHSGREAFYGLTTEHVCHQIILPETAVTKLSYMEHYLLDGNPDLVAPLTWYVSHTWLHCFLDFIDSLELFLVQQGSINSMSFWFCAFVNNQHLIDTTSFSFWSKKFQMTWK